MISYASCGFIAGTRVCISELQSSVPSGASMRVTSRGFTRMPPFANGAYAATSSTGVTPSAPSAIDGTGVSGLVMPLRRAAAITAASPTARLTRTVAAFADSISARANVMRPSYSSL